MADIKFACPSCSQHITCDELWGGHQIQCPGCQGNITVPSKPAPAPAPVARISSHAPAGAQGGNTLVPKVPEHVAPKLATAIPAQQPAQTGARNIPIRNFAAETKKKKNPLITALTVLGVVAVLGVGGYFGYGLVMNMQKKANDQARKEEANADGGQVGHIAEVNSVLNATEPDGAGSAGASRGSPPRQPGIGVGQEIPVAGDANADGTSPKPAALNLPVVAPGYTLDPARARIPESKVNGKISGTNFVADVIRLDWAQTSYLLRLAQGAVTSPEREIRIYLRLKAGEKIGGQKLQITPEMKGAGVPSVVKAWKTNPRYAAQTKTFSSGYAMTLELGQVTNSIVPGKIYVALPDPEETVAAGVFHADTSLGDGGVISATGATPALSPTPTSPNPMPSGPEADAFRKRYGIGGPR